MRLVVALLAWGPLMEKKLIPASRLIVPIVSEVVTFATENGLNASEPLDI